MLKAGHTCLKVDGPRHYPGTPFISNETTCVYLTTGERSVCDGNRWAHHKALCYCDGKVLYSYVNPTNSKLNIIFHKSIIVKDYRQQVINILIFRFIQAINENQSGEIDQSYFLTS